MVPVSQEKRSGLKGDEMLGWKLEPHSFYHDIVHIRRVPSLLDLIMLGLFQGSSLSACSNPPPACFPCLVFTG